MTNEFFEKTWCNEHQRNELLKKTKLVEREYFNNMNTTGENLVFRFIKVNESSKAKIFKVN